MGERRHANRNNPERSLRASPLPGLSTLCKQSVCRLLTAITGDRVKFLVHCGYTTRPRLPAIGTPQFAGYYLLLWWASLVAQRLKRLPGMRETWVQSLDREDQLEKEMGTEEGISTQREKQHWQGWEGMREEITNTRKKASEGEEDKWENRASQAQVSIYITD